MSEPKTLVDAFRHWQRGPTICRLLIAYRTVNDPSVLDGSLREVVKQQQDRLVYPPEMSDHTPGSEGLVRTVGCRRRDRLIHEGM